MSSEKSGPTLLLGFFLATGFLLATDLVLAEDNTGLPEKTQASKSAEAAQANNPLADFKAFNIQNYYVSELSELDDETANNFWLRYAQPLGKWLFRGSLPFSNVPTPGGENVTGVGDLNAFFAYLFDTGTPTRSFGLGPQVTLPTASDDATGTGKYQAGLASIYFDASSVFFQWGGLLTWQTDIAGDDDREDTNFLAFQPFYFFQMGKGFYLRGAPIWVYNLEASTYHMPIGLGIGKVMKSGTTVYNFFIEPQFTVLKKGPAQPMVQLYMALNMQFK